MVINKVKLITKKGKIITIRKISLFLIVILAVSLFVGCQPTSSEEDFEINANGFITDGGDPHIKPPFGETREFREIKIDEADIDYELIDEIEVIEEGYSKYYLYEKNSNKEKLLLIYFENDQETERCNFDLTNNTEDGIDLIIKDIISSRIKLHF